VAALKDLTELNLNRTQVTDAGVKELVDLKQLTELDLSGPRDTRAGVAELRKALPKCAIIRP
jgi:internalin A